MELQRSYRYADGMLTTRVTLLERLRDPTDQQSWDEFTHLYRPLFCRYVHKAVDGLGEHDTDDIVQEILISLLRKLPQFELDHERGRFRTFLWKVTHNAAIDWVRKRQRTTKLERQYDEALSVLEQAAASEPDDDWVREFRQRVFAAAVEQVRQTVEPKNPQKWNCFAQHVLKGEKAEVVAAALGISSNLVYVNASRVLADVRAACAEFQEDLSP